MNLKFIIILLWSISSISACASNKSGNNSTISMDTLPYASIPQYPEAFTANGVTARLIDGLGFRFYWATEGLREEDLNYRPDSSARTCLETMIHLQGLSGTIVNAVEGKPNIRPLPEVDYDYEEMRTLTLNNLKRASNILKNAEDGFLDSRKIVFQRGDKSSEFPFWHQYNGMIADALWHCGQVVSFRRSSGNPIDSRVNVFMGKLRER